MVAFLIPFQIIEPHSGILSSSFVTLTTWAGPFSYATPKSLTNLKLLPDSSPERPHSRYAMRLNAFTIYSSWSIARSSSFNTKNAFQYFKAKPRLHIFRAAFPPDYAPSASLTSFTPCSPPPFRQSEMFIFKLLPSDTTLLASRGFLNSKLFQICRILQARISSWRCCSRFGASFVSKICVFRKWCYFNRRVTDIGRRSLSGATAPSPRRSSSIFFRCSRAPFISHFIAKTCKRLTNSSSSSLFVSQRKIILFCNCSRVSCSTAASAGAVFCLRLECSLLFTYTFRLHRLQSNSSSALNSSLHFPYNFFSAFTARFLRSSWPRGLSLNLF